MAQNAEAGGTFGPEGGRGEMGMWLKEAKLVSLWLYGLSHGCRFPGNVQAERGSKQHCENVA